MTTENKKTIKVKVQQRVVFHKFAEVEIEIPYLIDAESEVQYFLYDNEHLFVDKMDKAISEAKLQCGNGVEEYKGMCELEADSEWRYEVNENGGHL